MSLSSLDSLISIQRGPLQCFRYRTITRCSIKRGIYASAQTNGADYSSWASQAGIVSPKVTLAYFGDLRGAKALDTIAPAEPFITVPRDAALVVGPKDRNPCPDFVSNDYWTKSPWYVKMAVLLLNEKAKGASSKVSGYISQLPTSIDTPVRWTDAEIKELQYQPLEQDIINQQKQWQAYHKDFISAASSSAAQCRDYESFLWAMENVRSRSFSGPYAGAPLAERLRAAALVATAGVGYVAWSHLPLTQALNGALAAMIFNLMYDVLLSQKLKWHAMCPVIDLLNHNSMIESEVEFQYFRDCFNAIVPSTGFNAGEQVFISYGKQTNSSLLQYYGFVEESNPNDVAVLTVNGDVKVTITAKGSATAESLAALKQSGTGQDVQEILVQAIKAELASKPTSIADDERLMQTAHMMSDRARMATMFRLQKKRILEKALQKLQKKMGKKKTTVA